MNLDLDSFIVIPLLAALGYEHVPLWGNALLAIWLWALGGNLGSFMNVVVYRVPLGRSVVHPGSRCPNCKTAIQWYDNIPVISWVLLRARCRHCKITISSRYPCVEALVAAVVLVVGFLSPVALGRNLPEPMTPVPMQFETVWLWLLFAFHVLLLCTLICAALIRYDRMLPPWRLFVPAAVVGCIAPMLPPIALWSGLRPYLFLRLPNSRRLQSLSGIPFPGRQLDLPWGSSLRRRQSADNAGRLNLRKCRLSPYVGCFWGGKLFALSLVIPAPHTWRPE